MSAISRREELLRCFRQEPIERIPVSPFIHVNHVKEFFASHEIDWVTRTPEVYAHYGFDLIHRNCSAAYDPYGPSGPGWEVERSTFAEGRDETIRTRIHTPTGEITCREELRWVYEYDAEVSPVVFPVKSAEDFERFREYQPPPEKADVDDIRRARQAVGEGGLVAPWIQGAFNLVAIYYRKLEDLLMDALLEPAFYGAMMECFLGRYKLFVQRRDRRRGQARAGHGTRALLVHPGHHRLLQREHPAGQGIRPRRGRAPLREGLSRRLQRSSTVSQPIIRPKDSTLSTARP